MAAAGERPANVLQRWHSYALSRITPDFAWAAPATEDADAPTVMERVVGDAARLRIPLDDHGNLALTFSLQPGRLAAHASRGAEDSSVSTPVLGALATPFVGSAANTGLSRHFGSDGQIDLGVVMVQQRFAASYLDGTDYSALRSQPGVLAVPESTHGVGMEVGIHETLLPGWQWFAGYRSRVNMDSFQTFRGIYGNPGDLDIPARMQLGVAWAALPRTQVRFGVERIQYSDIQPFVSTALPRRLLAVLGDATSPEFSWRDLDIYSVGVEHALSARNRVTVRYSTGQQPQPSSPLLASILMPDAADYSVGLSFLHQGSDMQWRLSANYAPSEFVLGVPSSAHRNHPERVRQLEFESLWMWRF